ncbi:MAG: sensor histidine kinase [Alicyclobacillus macrosporangiidus]|uniref:ATP-binding protein n=1 Tax=Alicyclobacillus macrosporangiidus TaxID=392015 RepID=UPI0026E95BD4|nr:sensor histidine kinase [Alicyclobacillus macrosporangiidus]MCL6600805.1 sensor histidine kinase [Alicyclobacillus macrosporangiidus]
MKTQSGKARKPMSLRAKLNWFVVLNAFVGLAFVTSGYVYLTIQSEFRHAGQRALDVAQAVATMPQIVAAFHTQNPAAVIQPLAESVRKKTGAQFVVVGNMQLIRYSHPNPDQIGKHMVGDDDAQVLQGKPSISEAVGTLGLSVRGKAPIFDHGKQIGVVSVGYLVSSIWRRLFVSLCDIAGLGVAALLLSLIGANLLSRHVKRQIYDMEPSEIAFLTQEQTAILESIEDGILAVDEVGVIKACNLQAAQLLGRTEGDMVGRHLSEAIHHPGLRRLLVEGPDRVAQPMILGDQLVLAKRTPVLLNGSVIGAVTTFRPQQALDQMERRLEDLERHAEALRSQRHEFMNRLHTIAGLIRLQEYDLVRELIDEVQQEQNEALSFFVTRIRDSAVVGLLVGKMHRARELGIDLVVHPDSHVGTPCPHRETVVTVLGNAIENAMEALSNPRAPERPKRIEVLIQERPDQLWMTVRDTGPGIPPQLGQRVFEDGVTTKGPGRGFGLSLCARLVARAHGRLAIVSSTEGATLEMSLPTGGAKDGAHSNADCG